MKLAVGRRKAAPILFRAEKQVLKDWTRICLDYEMPSSFISHTF